MWVNPIALRIYFQFFPWYFYGLFLVKAKVLYAMYFVSFWLMSASLICNVLGLRHDVLRPFSSVCCILENCFLFCIHQIHCRFRTKNFSLDVGYINKKPKQVVLLVWFLFLMAYQHSWIIKSKSHSYKRAAVILFKPLQQDVRIHIFHNGI